MRGNVGVGGPEEDPEFDRPLDLAALRADDALLDALGAGLVHRADSFGPTDDTDRELVSLLAAWVADVRPNELGAPRLGPARWDADRLDTDELDVAPRPFRADRPRLTRPVRVPTVAPSHSVPGPAADPARRDSAIGDGRRRSRAYLGRRIAAAALLAGLVTSGLAAGVSQSGGAVTPIASAERVRSQETAAQVRVELAAARTALQQGHPDEAAQAITRIRVQLPAVRADDGHAVLAQDYANLQSRLAAVGVVAGPDQSVLAAGAPSLPPSAFIDNLPDMSSRSGASGGSGLPAQTGADPTDLVLAEKGSADGAAGTAAEVDGAASGSASSGDDPATATDPDEGNPPAAGSVAGPTGQDPTSPDATPPDPAQPGSSQAGSGQPVSSGPAAGGPDPGRVGAGAVRKRPVRAAGRVRHRTSRVRYRGVRRHRVRRQRVVVCAVGRRTGRWRRIRHPPTRCRPVRCGPAGRVPGRCRESCADRLREVRRCEVEERNRGDQGPDPARHRPAERTALVGQARAGVGPNPPFPRLHRPGHHETHRGESLQGADHDHPIGRRRLLTTA